ncbi:MAG: dihydroorotase [Flammeovirgaceae bacterium]|nr:dihydroorotase [Flammeovirgaceae bacterium]
MEILLKNIKLVDSGHSLHNQAVFIAIDKGEISEISKDPIKGNAKYEVEGKGLSVSSGWFDMWSSLSEPGFEYKEDITSLSEAAAFGGFTDIAVLPNTNPVIQTKDAVNYIKNTCKFSPVQLHCIAALTKNAEGEEITEMIDLHHAGAVAFSDGTNSIWHTGVMSKALLYLQSFDGLLLARPEDPHLGKNGHMHEGVASTMLGTRGMPSISEELAVSRDLSLLRYTGGKIHFANISTKKGISLIREAKKEGLKVTCDVAAYQVAFTDHELMGFDTNLKVNPPFRGKVDLIAIWDGIEDGTIDAIVSNHSPQDQECKQLEFDLADFGMISLEIAFSIINTYKPEGMDISVLIEKLTRNPRRILKQEPLIIKEGKEACLTIFDENSEWTFSKEHIQSKSVNTPFIGKELTGRALGIINNQHFKYFEDLEKNYLVIN